MTYTQQKVKDVLGKSIDTFEEAIKGLEVDMQIIEEDGDINN